MRAPSKDPVIQWYPGHMAKAMRRLAQDVKLADVTLEVVDARVPRSGRNPALVDAVGHKPRLVVLEREDLADPRATAAWIEAFAAAGETAVAVNGKTQGTRGRLQTALKPFVSARGTLRTIVVGIPNAGKSTIINALARKNVARVEDRAGVTRTPQWFRALDGVEVMDTAGILVPKIDTPEAQWMLALTGALPRERFDPEDVVSRFCTWVVDKPGGAGVPTLEAFATERGFVRRGNILDTHNAARSFIKEFNDGGFGRMTLEWPAA
jgi:ribosome biogenesis GTPase A